MESSSQSFFSGYTFLFSMFVDQLMKLLIYMGHQVFSELWTPVYDCLVNISNKAPPGLPDFECARQVLSCPSKLLFVDVFLSQLLQFIRSLSLELLFPLLCVRKSKTRGTRGILLALPSRQVPSLASSCLCPLQSPYQHPKSPHATSQICSKAFQVYVELTPS